MNGVLLATLLASASPGGTASGTVGPCHGHKFTLKHSYAKQGRCLAFPGYSAADQYALILSSTPVSHQDLEAPADRWTYLYVPTGVVTVCFQAEGSEGTANVVAGGGEGVIGLGTDAVYKWEQKFGPKPVVKNGRVTGSIRTTDAGGAACRVDVSFDAPLTPATPAGK